MAKKGQNLVNGIDGVNGLPAIDFNASIREVQDAFIEGQPSIPDPSGTAQYGANNEIKQYLDLQTISRASAFICSGSGNAYVLTTDTAVHLRQFTFIQKYSKIHFIASFTNTGACTANVDFFGIKSIKLTNGSDPLAGCITANNRYTIYYNGTHWVLTNPTISTTYIQQPIILSNNSTNPNTQIDFAAGNFAFSDGSSFANLSAMTKRLDANWSAGTNQGGLDTGIKTSSTWYYCYAIYNPTTLISDVIFSINKSIPTLPSGYTKYKYIGSIRTNASGNILGFKQFLAGGNAVYVQWNTGIGEAVGITIPIDPTNLTQTFTVPSLDNILVKGTIVMNGDTQGQRIIFIRNSYATSSSYQDQVKWGNGAEAYDSFALIRHYSVNSQLLISSSGSFPAPNAVIMTQGYYDYNI